MQTPTQKHEDEIEEGIISSSSTLINKDEPCAVCSSTPNHNEEAGPILTGTSNPINKERNESEVACSSTTMSKGKQKNVNGSSPVDRQQAKTPDSYLNLLIEGCMERKTPDSYLRELLNAANVDTSWQGSPCSPCDSDFEEKLFSVGNVNLLHMKDQSFGEDDEHVSAPPPYSLNDLSKLELGEVTYGAVQPQRRASERPEHDIIVTVREVSEESSNTPSQIAKELVLREADRKERYEKLMENPQPSRRSSDESIGNRVKLTVAKMTKNFHMVTPSEESCEEVPHGGSKLYDFETDQMEVWDSVFLGSRTLQEVRHAHSPQETTSDAHQQQALKYGPLKSIPSGHRVRLPEVGNILQDSIKLRQLSGETILEDIHDQVDLDPSTTTSRSFQRQLPQSLLSRQRQSSSTVRVEFPKTMNLSAHTEVYETKTKAIAALYEYKLGELSNFCTFDPTTNTIFAHALESSVPNPAVLRQAGLEVLWLPMQKVISQMTQIQEETQEKHELSQIGPQRPTADVEKGEPEFTQTPPAVPEQTSSLNSGTLFAHNEAIVAADLYNFDRHGSQFESEKEIIIPHSRSSSLQPNLASPQREEESSVFDDDFFLEIDSDIAGGFLGSQYSEGSDASHNNDKPLLPFELFESEEANELLWSLDEEDQTVKPGRTWPELAKAFLAKQAAQTGHGSENQDIEPEQVGVMIECLKSGQKQDITPISTCGNLARGSIDDHCERSGHDSDYNDSESSANSAWASQFSTEFLSGNVSPTLPYTEHIEDIHFSRALSWKLRHSRRPGLSSFLADEDLLKLPKRNQPSGSIGSSSQSKDRSLFTSSESNVEVECPNCETTKEAEKSSGQVPEFINLVHASSPEVSEIPFPSKEVMDGSSRQTSISFTSYIEAERQRERLYQPVAIAVSAKMDNEAGEKEIIRSCSQIRATAEEDDYCFELADLLIRPAEDLNIESQYAQERENDIINTECRSQQTCDRQNPSLFDTSEATPTKGIALLGGETARSEAEVSENIGSSSKSPPIGFRFTAQRDQRVGRDFPKSQEVMSKVSESSAIPFPNGFRFTKHRKQIMRSEDSESPNISRSSSSGTDKTNIERNKGHEQETTVYHDAVEDVAAASLLCPEQTASLDIAVLDEDLGGRNQNVAKTEHGESLEFASEQTHENSLIKCLASAAEIEQLRKKILKECLAQAAALEEHSAFSNTSTSNGALNSSEEDTSKFEGLQLQRKAGCNELDFEKFGEPQNHASGPYVLVESPEYMFQPPSRSRPREPSFEDSNVGGRGKAVRQESPAKQESRVSALVDIFQARGMMPSMKPALHRKASPSSPRTRSGNRPTTPSARIVTPSGSMYHPAGTVCITAGRALSKSPIKRVPTPVSPFFRPSSGLSSIDTDMSEMFGEKLDRAEKHSIQCEEVGPYEEI